MGSDWQASYRAQFELDPIKTVGNGYLEQDLVDDARGVYVAIAQAIIEAYEQITGRDFEPNTEEPLARIRRNLGIA